MIALVNSHAFHFPIAANRCHLVTFSPPYFGLREYGVNGQLGQEALLDCYAWTRQEPPCGRCFVCNQRTVAAEVWRVLHPKGLFVLNIGDSYAGSSNEGGTNSIQGSAKRVGAMHKKAKIKSSGMKQKDLMLVPAAVAMALRADGWYLRSEIIWAKPNPMPESVTDRPTKSHEMVYIFAKSPDYFCDMEAVKEPVIEGYTRGPRTSHKSQLSAGHNIHKAKDVEYTTRNLRDVWNIATHSYPGSHFATWPPELVNLIIKMCTSEKGACPKCGNQWERVVEKISQLEPTRKNQGLGNTFLPRVGTGNASKLHHVAETKTIGWRPTCQCPAHDPTPALVLDPFCGSGTTLQEARRLGRSAIGCDLSMAYLQNCAIPRLQIKELAGAAIQGGGTFDDLPLFQNKII